MTAQATLTTFGSYESNCCSDSFLNWQSNEMKMCRSKSWDETQEQKSQSIGSYCRFHVIVMHS